MGFRSVVTSRTISRRRRRPAAKTSGRSAGTRLIRPPPSRIGDTSFVPFVTGAPVRTSADLICATVHVGWRCRRSAAPPATWGAAMLVPLNSAHVPSRVGTDESTPDPGATTSGFNRNEYGVGAPDEKSTIRSGRGEPCAPVEAPTAIARGAFAGEPTDPLPKSLKSFPAETTGTTPAAAAASIARTTMSRVGSISTSPNEQLITSMPSRTAASTAATISGAFPSRPNCGVGTVSAL